MEPSHQHTAARPIECLLSAISSISATITRFIRSVRAAHADLASLTRELSDLRLLLELLRDEPDMPLLLQGQMLSVLDCCGEDLGCIDTTLAQSADTARWTAYGRADIAVCRTTLAVFREALALALEVASLYSTAASNGSVDGPGIIRDNILSEVQRLQRDLPTAARLADGNVSATLLAYLDAVSSCVLSSPLEDRHCAQPSMDRGTGLEPEEDVILIKLGDEHACQRAFLESPTLPPLHDQASQAPQRSLPPPLNLSVWTQSGSLSTTTRSEPSGSTGHLDLESPTISPGRNSDPIHNPANWSPFRDPSSSTTSSSLGRVESPRDSVMSVPRESSKISPLSDARPGSISPDPSSPGPSKPFPIRASSFPYSPPPFSPPPRYRLTPGSKPTHRWTETVASVSQLTIPAPAKHSPHQSRVEVTLTSHLTDKGKGADISHIDASPDSSYVATRHNKAVKIWSIAKNALHGTIKVTSYFQPKARSREFFIHSHAILSDAAALIAITTHFGLTLEIYNFSQGGTGGAKRVQVIDEAHRWAASQRDVAHSDIAPLAIYRPKGDRIDLYHFSHQPPTPKNPPFLNFPSLAIELLKSNLPFLPKFPELAYSSDSPLLLGAAGPRPGDPPRAQAIILAAWQLRHSPSSSGSNNTPSNKTNQEDDGRHAPYRYTVPPYSALQSALPVALAARARCAVSLWIPAPTTTTSSSSNNPAATSHHQHHDPVPRPAAERYVLVWDLEGNATRIFTIPNVQVCCVAPTCRRVAYYCEPAAAAGKGGRNGECVVVDVESQKEVWRSSGSPAAAASAWKGAATALQFSRDGARLLVGDGGGGGGGGVGMYEVSEEAPRFELPGAEAEVAQVGGGGRLSRTRLGSLAVGELP